MALGLFTWLASRLIGLKQCILEGNETFSMFPITVSHESANHQVRSCQDLGHSADIEILVDKGCDVVPKNRPIYTDLHVTCVFRLQLELWPWHLLF